MVKRNIYRPNSRVRFNCPTAEGAISGEGRVLRMIEAVEGDYGRVQFLYLVAAGDALKVIPGEYMTPTRSTGDDAECDS